MSAAPLDPAIFATDYAPTPYWQRALPHVARAGVLARTADVVVIGAGLTGAEAARVLAASGSTVLVLDAGEPGAGASSRNAGMVGRNFKHSYGELSRTLGKAQARAYFDELEAAFQATVDLGTAHADAIGWRRTGRLITALSGAHWQRLRDEYRLRQDELGEDVRFLDRAALAHETGCGWGHGAVVVNDNATLHPGRYTAFMLSRAVAAGAVVQGQTPVQAVERVRGGFHVVTPSGTVYCRDVLVATNGYTGNALPWFKKRLLPIRSWLIATEPLTPEQAGAVATHRRSLHDNRRRTHYATFSPAGDRLVFGGHTGARPIPLDRRAAGLLRDLTGYYSQLRGIKIAHAWQGACAATRDLYPKVGRHENGVHYALGYCFSGNAMAPWLARKAAAMILGRQDQARTLFSGRRFAPMPMAARVPFSMPALMAWYAFRDRPRL